MKVIAENLTIKTKYAGLLKEVGEPVAYYYKDHNGHWCFMVKPYCNSEPLFTSDQLVAAILKATKPLEEEVERLKTVPMKYRRMAFNAQLQDENKELRTQLANTEKRVTEACALACEDVIGNTANYQRMIAAIDCSAMINAGEWRKFVKEV